MAVATRLRPFGSTIFTEVSARALEVKAVNLGQGFPDFEGPDFVKEAAKAGIDHQSNQYPPSMGIPALREAVAARFEAQTGRAVDPNRQVTITSGCTEALAASFLGLLEPKDPVILLQPWYDCYPVGCALSDAAPRYVTLRPPGFRLPEAELRAAFEDGARAIVINTPHNPTGRVFSRSEMDLVAELCVAHDVLAFTDEVYEHIRFDGVPHRSLAAWPGMWERTVTMSSVGKSFSVTGWKTGWAVAPEHLTAGVRAAHQFLTFTTPNPMQYGTAAALSAPQEYFEGLQSLYTARRDLLAEGLDRLGFGVYLPQGTYFLMADHRPFGFGDDISFVHHLIEEVGVAAIPPSVFYDDPADGAGMVRFAFCKSEETLRAALERMEALRR
ncbi:MAG: aminotransferase class I/II-fold pyridoxal phosphate-dependent enzyme [bacterium]|nr:aminotransferase class I/II-fold pyridoxal phosphate-dependent enzyme [Acidimicrobiia bacterium]MCY4650896.1 aminotransferase class I/II-fold pyridoxal phosphate-dependent enzyme [bacterium]